MTRRELRAYVLGVRRARKEMTAQLNATARAVNDEIEALRCELHELKAEVARKREIEAALEVRENFGMWLQ